MKWLGRRDVPARDREAPPRLPPELEALQEQLERIEFRERPSFGPELEAELEHLWARIRHEEIRARTNWSGLTQIAAAVAGILLVGGAAFASWGPVTSRLGSPVGPPSSAATDEEGISAALLLSGPEAPPVPTLAPSDELWSETGASDADRFPVPSLPILLQAKGTYDQMDLAPWGFDEVPASLENRAAAEAIFWEYYPEELREKGVGGKVVLRVLVDEEGKVDEVRVLQHSMSELLDRAAIDAASTLRMRPARTRSGPISLWVQLSVNFRPNVAVRSITAIQRVVRELTGESDERAVAVELGSTRRGAASGIAGNADEAEGARPPALGFGPPERSLDPPLSSARSWGSASLSLSSDESEATRSIGRVLPLQRPEDVAADLEARIESGETNPVYYLTLAHIANGQGNRAEARRLLEDGIAALPVPEAQGELAFVASQLYYERGLILRDKWRAGSGLGRIGTAALDLVPCEGAPAVAEGELFATREVLVRRNFVCPDALETLLDRWFEPRETGNDWDRVRALRSFELSMRAWPGHTNAITEILLTFADRGDWDALLRATDAAIALDPEEPEYHLLAGIALNELGRPEEAAPHFVEGRRTLLPSQSLLFTDPTPFLTSEERRQWSRLDGASRSFQVATYWDALDPDPTTMVNERLVEHWSRVAFAMLRFGEARSDAGRIWIKMGRPLRRLAVEDARGEAVEFWDYGPGPDVPFRRIGPSAELVLTREGQLNFLVTAPDRTRTTFYSEG